MRVIHVIARVNLGGTARWLETLTAEQLAAGDEVLVATGQVQGDEFSPERMYAEHRAAYAEAIRRRGR